MLRFVVLFCAVFALAKCQSTAVSQCTSNPGELPINAYIEGCPTPPCALPQLEDVVINVVFRAPRILQNMRTLATAFMSLGIIAIPIPYDLGVNAVTCNFLTNTYCPLLPNEVVQYQLRMFIESFFPAGTQVTIEFRVVDEANSPVWCIRVPVSIVPPRVTDPNTISDERAEHNQYHVEQQ